ncbi:hypothetical protein VL20_6084 [Microcystis panniformis FACHB-1757]|uniref:Uncharacterized protein n=1 Tax=Microcystis panniformis FACHB-1757 TaxID=1638788 RepID=A0A0K1S9Q8_9CHRO|nr:hypothetical protein VL20_6084 [Microcystis panniformis FACHB-1757]
MGLCNNTKIARKAAASAQIICTTSTTVMIITLYFPLQSIAVIISYQLSVISYQM